MRLRVPVALLVTLAAAPALAADGGGALVVGAPRGALGQAADVAGGVAGHALFGTGAVALRLEGSWLLYGSETVRVPVARTAGRIAREITTDNWVAQLGAGPQLVLRAGGWRPYVHAFAGASYLSTTSELRDPDGFVSAASTNFDDTGLSYGGGVGVLIPLRGGGTAIDVGLRYVRTGSVRFLAEGDLVPDGGGVRAMPRHGQADVLEFRVGLAFGARKRPSW
jgi:hypothetical protein